MPTHELGLSLHQRSKADRLEKLIFPLQRSDTMRCKGICKDYKAARPTDKRGRYEAGQRRCNTCEIFIEYDKLVCPCCGMKLRTKPRSKTGKERMNKGMENAASGNDKTARPSAGTSAAHSTPNMDWGLANRMASIIKPEDNRALMLAVDHGYFLGPTERLEVPRDVITPLLNYCDSLMLTRGVQRTSVPPTTQTPMVLRVSGGSSIIGDDLSREDITVSIQDAIRLNAAALAISIFVGSKYEYQTIVNLGRLVSQAQEYNMPVLAVTAVGKELGKDARYLSLACRVAAEQGAHIVKTYYCEDFKEVTGSCPVPIIVAGGKKIPEMDALDLTYKSICGGAAGVDMGRNIWQSDHPVSMIQAVRSIIHGTNDADQAYLLYQDLVREEGILNKGE